MLKSRRGEGLQGFESAEAMFKIGRNDGSLHCPQRILPRAREARIPPEQRKAEITKVIFIHFRKEE